jgi:hypothetical protein
MLTRGLCTSALAARPFQFQAARIVGATAAPTFRTLHSARTLRIENTRIRADGGVNEIPHHGVGVDKDTRMHS